MAERGGFEPPIRLHVCRISSAVHSTTLPPLRPDIRREAGSSGQGMQGLAGLHRSLRPRRGRRRFRRVGSLSKSGGGGQAKSASSWFGFAPLWWGALKSRGGRSFELNRADEVERAMVPDRVVEAADGAIRSGVFACVRIQGQVVFRGGKPSLLSGCRVPRDGSCSPEAGVFTPPPRLSRGRKADRPSQCASLVDPTPLRRCRRQGLSR